MQTSIETRSLSRIFRSKVRGEAAPTIVKALDKVNLSVNEGELFGLLGPNGAGKTTLIKILCTLLLPTEGKAFVGGYDVVSEAVKVREIINMASGGESPGYGLLTVRENMWFFSQLYGLRGDVARPRIKELLGEVGLSDRMNEKMNRLSSGLKQRLNVARAFINDPDVVFLDEPTLGLDVYSARKIRGYVRDWVGKNPHKMVLLTTHYMAEADELCDRVAIINQGKIVACDSPANLKNIVKKESVFRMEVANANDRIEGVETIPFIKGVTQEPNVSRGTVTLKMVVEDEAAISDVYSLIAKSGGRVMYLAKAEPTLEDVFISLVGRGLE